MLPNYLGARGGLFRWERFPVRLSIDRDSLGLVADLASVYQSAIGEGAAVWSIATGGVIGSFNVGFDTPDAEIVVRVSDWEHPETGGEVDVDRRGTGVRRATIILYHRNILPVGATGQPYLTHLIAHEMGHALGVLKHSDDRRDLMNPLQPVDTPYPWVTQRDLNTMGHAYCR